ncbi:eCIS core domain-containing protein [Thermococcus stetteri]|uniref:eCIS core domain-containing protein n=1 Tax=Thermococcus stetteri TaxID=49900 RepID=UPI001AE21CE8|nr:DUF4157 domain-containing protein [Thermococcus stetteri]MBP1911224.1 hypothetical protein [Thermococcus stetteri]
MWKPGTKTLALGLILLLFSSLYSAVKVSEGADSILKETDKILAQVEEIRGLTFKEKPRIVVISKATALEMWKPGQPDLEKLRREELVYKMTLLLPPDYKYIREESERSAGWIAATVGDTIYIIEENFMADPDTARRTIAHESVHVLQKQWFNAKYGADTFDGTLAVQALVEGDADLVADIYCERNGIPIHKIRSLSGDPLTDIHIFPYVFGDSFVRYLYEKGNWTLVNRAYKYYPETTLQVMVPEYYLENRTPENVTLEVPENWTVLRDDRMGAFYVYVLMGDVAKLDNGTAWNVSAGWLGDRLILANNGTNYVLLWKVKFKGENAAELFAETLKKLAEGNTYATFEVTQEENTVILKAVRRVRIEA